MRRITHRIGSEEPARRLARALETGLGLARWLGLLVVAGVVAHWLGW